GLARRGCPTRGGTPPRDANGGAQRGAPRRHWTARPPAGPALAGMTRLVDVPAQFDDRAFEQFAGAYVAAARDGERLLFGAHAAVGASPYGPVGLLAAGQAAWSAGPPVLPLLPAPHAA